MNSFQEKFDKVKNPEKYLTKNQIKEGDELAKKISILKAITLLIGYCWIGYIIFLQLFFVGHAFFIIWIFFQHKEFTKQLKFIEKEFSE